MAILFSIISSFLFFFYIILQPPLHPVFKIVFSLSDLLFLKNSQLIIHCFFKKGSVSVSDKTVSYILDCTVYLSFSFQHTDGALLSIVGFPAFAIDNEKLHKETRERILSTLVVRL